MNGETGESMDGIDLLGRRITGLEAEVLQTYRALKSLAGRDDVPPCVSGNVRKALACVAQVVNDLDLEFENLYDVGC
jgi:hypothetical protein